MNITQVVSLLLTLKNLLDVVKNQKYILYHKHIVYNPQKRKRTRITNLQGPKNQVFQELCCSNPAQLHV
jgi:hypothetical protein